MSQFFKVILEKLRVDGTDWIVNINSYTVDAHQHLVDIMV